MTERDIFLSAMEIEDPAERTAHLQEACGGDADLRARVEALLASHESRSRFLRTPVMDQMSGDPTMADDATQLSDSTRDADASLEYNGPDTLLEDCDMSDEIPLGYLEPSSKEGSLGRLGHYEIEEVLGRGAFGTVLKAFDEKLHRVVAIKVLSPQMAATSPARKRFLREARSSARIRHEHVVAIYGVEEEPIPYLVMEYIPGQTLQQRLDEHGPLEVKDVVRLGKQMADGLAAAHAEGLIHRDIKPGNILLDTSVADRVKVTDFGLARTADDASMTQSGMIAGTPMYMAPEQALGKKIDQRADLFSFGSVLYQMLSGRPPFRAPNTMAVLKRVTEDTPRPIREVIPEVPDWMCEIVGHLLAKDPDDRYASAKEVSELLAKCLADLEAGRKPKVPAPAKTAEGPPARVRSTESRLLQRPLPKVAAVVLLLLAGLAVTEATDVTQLASTVFRIATGEGTLIVEVDDPSLSVTVDRNGDELTVSDGTHHIFTLVPGQHDVLVTRDGEPVRQELVTITRNERIVVRMSMEPVSPESGVGVVSESQFPPDAPFTDDDVARIANLPAEEQVEEVRRELIRRNPGFDGQLIPTIEDDKVTGLEFRTYHVTDISPVRALVHLERLVAKGDTEKGLLSDLSPLQGMQLAYLNVNYNDKLQSLDPLRGMSLKIMWCYECPISDLSPLQGTPLEELHLWIWTGADLTPLKGMPLKRLNVGGNSHVQDLSALADLPLEYLCINQTQVSDLTPLQGLPLEHLSATATHVSDLSPLRGKKLTRLTCDNSNVSDLSALRGMPLREIRCDFQPTRDTEILRSIETLETINDKPAAEFWQDVDAGLPTAPASEDEVPAEAP